jgi:hypothetical protein
MAITEAVRQAITEIEGTFESGVTTREDGQGGAYVIVEDAPLAGPWTQDSTWVGFHIAHTYPYADVYPHFIRGDLTRRDGQPAIGPAMSHTQFEGRQGIQLSRRSNRRDPQRETALMKLLKVLEWMETRP